MNSKTREFNEDEEEKGIIIKAAKQKLLWNLSLEFSTKASPRVGQFLIFIVRCSLRYFLSIELIHYVDGNDIEPLEGSWQHDVPVES